MRFGKVEIYGTENCVWCKRAKEFMELNDLEYQYTDMTNWVAEDLMYFVEDKAPGARTVPIILLNGKYLGGFTQLKDYFQSRKAGWKDYAED